MKGAPSAAASQMLPQFMSCPMAVCKLMLSSCGKSTCLRMIAGLEEVTDGEIYIGDRVVNSVDPKDRDIAMVFQNYALYLHMSVYDNMAFGLKLRRIPSQEIKKRVEDAADILG